MANKTYAIKMADGSVSVMTLVSGTVEESIAKWDNAADVISHVEIVPDSQPASREFRNAWDVTGDVVDVDMPKAKVIHQDNLRMIRKPLLAALDVDYQRAQEDGDTAGQVSIVAKKQELRDVPEFADISAATTPDELSAAIPDCHKS